MRITPFAVAVMAAASLVFVAPVAQAAPPPPPDEATARTHLDELVVADEGSMDGYTREKFPHWSNQGDNCNTREVVLKRDGDGVTTDSQCRATGGS